MLARSKAPPFKQREVAHDFFRRETEGLKNASLGHKICGQDQSQCSGFQTPLSSGLLSGFIPIFFYLAPTISKEKSSPPALSGREGA